MATDHVEIVPADPSWPTLYAREVDAICQVLGTSGLHLQCEHVGSTAVPGLAAKPIIDILVVPPDDAWPREELRAALALLGYVFWEENPDPTHLFFVKGMPPFGDRRTHHVHVRPSAPAQAMLAFRDTLRARPDVAGAYEALKRDLARRFPAGREAYTRGKSEFIRHVLADPDGP